MRAVRFHEFGPADRLRLDDIPVPAPDQGQVLVRVQWAGVNPIDAKYRAGLLQGLRPIELPFLPGSEMCGTVVTGAGRWKAGARVFGMVRGSYAEYALAAAEDLQPCPPDLEGPLAASVPLGSLTAWTALEEAGVSSGCRVLVQGAAGGVGLYVAQLARLRGAEVWGTCSSAHAQLVTSWGITALDYTRLSPEDPAGFDVVIDSVGGTVFLDSLTRVRVGGKVIALTGPVDASAVPPGIEARFVRRGPAVLLARVLPFLESRRLHPVVRTILPLDQAADAHRLCETGHGAGRIILEV